MRLVTRGDVDGVMCAALLKAVGMVDDMLLVHPREMQDGLVAVGPEDIICNLPYARGCALWFDHHSSEDTPERLPEDFDGAYGVAPSAARLVYEYLRGDHPELERFEPTLVEVDRFDSAEISRSDLERPGPTMLLAFILDPRTGLGAHHSFGLSDEEVAEKVSDWMVHLSVQEILEQPGIRDRVDAYFALVDEAVRVFSEHVRVDGNVLILDLRRAKWVPPANRFLVYTLPGCEQTNVGVRVALTGGGQRVVFQVGYNIFNRTSTADIGSLMAAYGGGGHRGAGSCQAPLSEADRVLEEIAAALRE